MSGLMGARELMEVLGLKKSRFHILRARGMFRMFEVSRPLGQKRYSRALVEDYLRGQSMARLGRRVC